jgi:hypothetical protein
MCPDVLPPEPGQAAELTQLVASGSVCRASELAVRMEAFPVYRIALDWLQNTIMQPHADLLRPGAVCPFVAQSMAQDCLIFGVRLGAKGGAQDAFDLMLPFIAAFGALEPAEGPLLALKALTVFFPDLPEADWQGFIDGGHQLLKPVMVERGLMLGEFHPNSTKPGATNPAFRAMRAPVPAFVIREMAMHDTKFINDPGESPERRALYLRSYLERIGPVVPRKMREAAERMLDGVKAEMDRDRQN